MGLPKYFYLKDLKLNLDNDYLELNRIQKTSYIEVLEKYYNEYFDIYRKFLIHKILPEKIKPNRNFYKTLELKFKIEATKLMTEPPRLKKISNEQIKAINRLEVKEYRNALLDIYVKNIDEIVQFLKFEISKYRINEHEISILNDKGNDENLDIKTNKTKIIALIHHVGILDFFKGLNSPILQTIN